MLAVKFSDIHRFREHLPYSIILVVETNAKGSIGKHSLPGSAYLLPSDIDPFSWMGHVSHCQPHRIRVTSGECLFCSLSLTDLSFWFFLFFLQENPSCGPTLSTTCPGSRFVSAMKLNEGHVGNYQEQTLQGPPRQERPKSTSHLNLNFNLF